MSPLLRVINRLVLMRGQGGNAGMTVQPMFRVPVPSEAYREGSSQLRAILQQLSPLGPCSKPGSRQGRENPASWWKGML